MTTPLSDVELGREAFMAASNRFTQTIAAGEVSLWYAALGETLWWIVGLDEHYRKVGRDAYIAFQQSDVDGRVIPGLS
ncbi:hypothetical protein ACQI5H_23180 [Mycobacterium heidelbergense]|uniref:hypothetical protein n=1 Tax=Mycobacterium heidelbergense TaxID=53376 RepID=UPI003CEB87BD